MSNMRMTTITYAATVNLGNYESERIEITAEINNDDVSPADVVDALRAHVESCTLRPGWTDRAKGRAAEAVGKAVAAQVDPFAGFPDE